MLKFIILVFQCNSLTFSHGQCSHIPSWHSAALTCIVSFVITPKVGWVYNSVVTAAPGFWLAKVVVFMNGEGMGAMIYVRCMPPMVSGGWSGWKWLLEYKARIPDWLTTMLLYENIIPLSIQHRDGLMQERRNSIANALELRLSCIKPLIYIIQCILCDIQFCSDIVEHRADLELTKDTSYLTPTGEPWGVYSVLSEYWLCWYVDMYIVLKRFVHFLYLLIVLVFAGWDIYVYDWCVWSR